MRHYAWLMRLTHIPTGITVETGEGRNPPARGLLITEKILMKLLKSKVWLSRQNMDLAKEVRTYSEELFFRENTEEILSKALKDKSFYE